MSNANSPSATSATTVTPIASLASPNSTTPATYSHLAQRRHEQVQQVARPRLLHEAGREADLGLEDDVEEEDPGEQEAGRLLAAAARSGVRSRRRSSRRATASTTGHTTTSNQRCGDALQHVHVPPGDCRTRSQLTLPSSRCSGTRSRLGQMQEHAFEVGRDRSGRRPRRAAVGDDLPPAR